MIRIQTFSKFLIVFLLGFSVLANEKDQLIVTSDLSPVGTLSMASQNIRGHLRYSVSKKAFLSKRLYVEIKKIKSGIDLRDKHIQEFLMVEKNPFIELRDVKAKNGRGEGFLEIGKKSKKVEFEYSQGEEVLEASFSVDTNDFDLSLPSFFGVSPTNPVLIKVFYPIRNVKKVK